MAGVNGGELFNGMVMPFTQMAIKGALWCKQHLAIALLSCQRWNRARFAKIVCMHCVTKPQQIKERTI
jgi:hypothetical protein